MTHVYTQSSFPSGDRTFESARNTETEQVRTLDPLRTFYTFTAGITTAAQILEWTIPTDLVFDSFWVHYAAAPSGTITANVYNPAGGLTRTLSFNTNNNGEKFDNAWAYRFDKTFALEKGSKVRLTPSVNINGVAAYGQPCLLFDPFDATRVA